MLVVRMMRDEERKRFGKLEEKHRYMGEKRSGGDTLRLVVGEDGRQNRRFVIPGKKGRNRTWPRGPWAAERELPPLWREAFGRKSSSS